MLSARLDRQILGPIIKMEVTPRRVKGGALISPGEMSGRRAPAVWVPQAYLNLTHELKRPFGLMCRHMNRDVRLGICTSSADRLISCGTLGEEVVLGIVR